MTTFGVDISHYQGTLDFAEMAHEGVIFCAIKATEGSVRDPNYATYRKQSTAAGLITGFYHFLIPGNGTGQASAFISTIGDPKGYLVMLDVERPGVTYKNVTDFAAEWKRRFDHPLFIYSGISEWHTNMANKPMPGPLWLAYYPTPAGYPGDSSVIWKTNLGGQTPVIWQYGPRRIVGHAPVDGDAFRGTPNQLRAYTGIPGGGPNIPGGDVRFVSANGYRDSSIKLLNVGDNHEWLYLDGSHGGVIAKATALVCFGLGDATTGKYVCQITTGTPYGDKVARPTLVLIASSNSVYDAPVAPVDCTAQIAAAVAPLNAQIKTLQGTVSDREDRLHKINILSTV